MTHQTPAGAQREKTPVPGSGKDELSASKKRANLSKFCETDGDVTVPRG